jgi:hypothetical protein
MATAERPIARSVKGVYDGTHVVLSEPLDVAAGTEVVVTVVRDRRTWAEVHLGMPHIELRGDGPTLSEMIIEDRR